MKNERSSADYADSRTLEEREAEDKRMVECRSHIDSLYEKKAPEKRSLVDRILGLFK